MKKLSNITTKKVSSVLREYGGVSSPVSVSSKSNGINFFEDVLKRKRLEVVIPEMHYLDAEVIEEMYENDLKEKHPNTYHKIEMGEIAKVPNNVLHDLFQLHLLRTEDVTLELSDVNKGSYNLMKKMNDADMKMITNHSSMNSYIIAKNLMFYLQLKLDDLDEKPKQDQGEGGQGDDDLSELLSNMLDQISNNGSDPMESVKQQAKAEIQEMEESKDMIDEITEGNEAGKGESIRTVKQDLINKKLFKDININNKVLSDMLKHSLNSSVSYFTSNYTEYYESIFDSDDINELHGLEAMMPLFKMFKMDELDTISRKYKLAIDVYIDVSGSMTASQLFGKDYICFEDIAKLITLKIASKKILKDIYLFDTKVTGPHSKKKMMTLSSRGGTDLNVVIDQINELKRPSVIITDAQDYIRNYSELAYFIGVNSPSLSGDTNVISKFKLNKQGIEYTRDNAFKEIRYN